MICNRYTMERRCSYMENIAELEFISCDLHPGIPAIHMDISPDGAVIFECIDCIRD